MIYSQSFFFSALREDSSKSNSRALRSRAEFHSLQKAILFSVTVGLCVLFAVVGARNKDTPRTGTKNIMVYCWLARESGIFALADDRPVALVLLGDSWVPQNVVEASANSLWQGGWRRTHSVKGGLPK